MQFGKEPQILGKIDKREKPIERLGGFVEKMSAEMKAEGIPVDNNGRINMDKFEEAYPRRIIEADRFWIKELKERWARAKISDNKWSWAFSKEKILEQKTLGEAWEMLALAILHKNLGNDFIVVRTSEYDDVRNGVDSIIIDKKSGDIVCAFDDVGAVSGRIFEAKKGEVLRKNWERGGADVVYGISFDEKQGKPQLRKGRINHIPLFYFSSPEDTVREGLNNFSETGISQIEQRIFKGFIDLLFGLEGEKGQIELLKESPLHSKLRQRLESSERSLEKFKTVVK